MKLQRLFKRIIDIIGSLAGLIILSPVFLIVSILVYIKLGSPIFFTQERVGKNGKIFKMIKFRTMLDSTNKFGELLDDEERLTPFGKKTKKHKFRRITRTYKCIKRGYEFSRSKTIACRVYSTLFKTSI